ncbi:glycoside hydrolase domain-containing protein [Streptomyces polygonati]|uniref:Glycoside hydrolase domain-containing protein n=1 Tax=Streptomyces polygonati TaxID=1617087 RepID=A0ABV8HR70_9ACTN
MTTILGVDYAWSHPGGAALAAAGKKFAARYLSGDTSKNLTRAEADDLAAHGVASVVVWESTADRAGQGYAAGAADAERAVLQAQAAGKPDSRPIYFAVDYDADSAIVAPYFRGVASVIGLARTGVYGGYRTVKYMLDYQIATWAWQTTAWSGGRWDPRAHIRQGGTVTIHGVSCDLNTATTTDYGQWTPAHTPTVQEDDMPLSKADVELFLSTEMDDPTKPGSATVTVRGALWAAYGQANAANAAAQKNAAQVGALQAVVTQLLAAVKSGSTLTPAQATAAAETGAKAALAELGAALTS